MIFLGDGGVSNNLQKRRLRVRGKRQGDIIVVYGQKKSKAGAGGVARKPEKGERSTGQNYLNAWKM